jgi:RpiR family transcriptional regulator, carbohydrate utilization regulator
VAYGFENRGTGVVASRVRSMLPTLADAEVRVARWLLEEPQRLLNLSMAQVAQACGVSDTTVLRFCRSVGFRGFTDVKLAVAGDVTEHDRLMVDGLSADDDISDICAKVFRANAQALADTAATLDMEALRRAVDLLAGARRVIVIGVGTSIPIVLDLHHKLFRIGLDSVAHTDSYLQLMAAALLDHRDVVVGISHSGTSIDPALTLEKARERGCNTIAVTGNGQSPFTKSADVTLLSVASELRPEALASRVAQMAIVDVLYVALSMRDPERALESERRAFDSVIAKMI